ncbi:unnamed protein product, partial [marine sediment metagenome]
MKEDGLGATDQSSYLALEVSLTNAELVGVPGLVFRASGEVLVNRTTLSDGTASTTAAERLDWYTASTTNDSNDLLPDFSAKLIKAISLSIDGSVWLDMFGFVVGGADLKITQADMSVNDDAITAFDASVMSVELTNLNLFVGAGAKLDDNANPTALVTGEAVGFSVSGTVKMALVKEDGLGATDQSSYLALEVSLAGAELVGIEGLVLKAEGSVLVNKATDAAGDAVTDRIDWATATDTGSLLPDPGFGTKLTSSIELNVSGAASMDVFGFVVGTATFEMTTGTADVDTKNTNIDTDGILSNASVMSLTLTNLNLFAGVGATLNENGTPLDQDDDKIDTSGAIGFSISDGTIKFASVRPASTDPDDLTAYTGVEISIEGAELVGIEGLVLKAEGS